MGAFWVGSRLADPWCFLLDFFFVVEGVPDAAEEDACCGAETVAGAMVAQVVATENLAASVRSSEAAIGTW